jgi:dihydrofolate reductase
MSRVTVFNHVSLDGVMQAPGRPEEDIRGGFTRGGWAGGRMDEVIAGVAAQGMSRQGAMLFGRRTYEDFAKVWPKQAANPFTEALNKAQKYVASRTLREPLPWVNSTLLQGDAADAVARLKEAGPDLVILGSGELIQSLMRRRLIDQFILMIHPLLLGRGRRLFAADAEMAELKLVDSKTSTTGVIIATYELAP